MKRIQNKLTDRRGASILLALLLFMMCTFAGGAALAAASGSANALLGGRAERQDYLTVASAARLLRGQLDRAVFTARYTMREYYYDAGETDGEGNAVYASAWEFPNSLRSAAVTGAALSGLLEEDCSSLFRWKLPDVGFKDRFEEGEATGSLPVRRVLTLQPDETTLPEGFEGLDEVEVTWLLCSDFSLYITLSLSDDRCPMTLTVPPVGAELSERLWTENGPAAGYDDRYVEQSIRVTWPADGAVIDKGA